MDKEQRSIRGIMNRALGFVWQSIRPAGLAASRRLLGAGVDLMAISKLLGHSSFVTTMVYLHCRKQHLGATPSPLDWLPTRQCPRWVDPTLESSDKRPSPDESDLPPESNGQR